MKSGFYEDVNSNLQKLSWDLRQGKIEKHNIVANITRSLKFYTFIKVIKDDHNPQLEGETLVFIYGRTLDTIIKKEKDPKKKQFFLVRQMRQQFPTFEHSYFSGNSCDYYDTNLNINNHVSYTTLNVPALEKKLNRKAKLEYIQKQTSLKDELLLILEKDESNEIKVGKIINLISEI